MVPKADTIQVLLFKQKDSNLSSANLSKSNIRNTHGPHPGLKGGFKGPEFQSSQYIQPWRTEASPASKPLVGVLISYQDTLQAKEKLKSGLSQLL